MTCPVTLLAKTALSLSKQFLPGTTDILKSQSYLELPTNSAMNLFSN